MIKVLNIKKDNLPDNWRELENYVYIGFTEESHGVSESLLCNTFKGKKKNILKTIEKYKNELEEYLNPNCLFFYDLKNEFKRIVEIARQGDLHLVCWCAPRLCHGDVIKEMIESILEEEKSR